MPEAIFNALIHTPNKLQICSYINTLNAPAEFTALKEQLEVSDSVLSKHIKALEDANYVSTEKRTGIDGRKRTWISLTNEGQTAFHSHVKALKEIVG